MRILNKVKALYYTSLLGWNTKKRIVVFESDDWGSIRMPSLNVFNKLVRSGVDVSSNPFNKYDSLESNDDLELLFSVLSKHKDAVNNPATLTANTIVANPDFEKIRGANFTQYFYQPFTDTLKEYPRSDKVHVLIEQGRSEGCFQPQFHGREHVNVGKWMALLQQREPDVMSAFDHNVFCLDLKTKVARTGLLATFDFESRQGLLDVNHAIEDGLFLFKRMFNFQSKTAIAPSAVWHPASEQIFKSNGVRCLQGYVVQKIPRSNSSRFKLKYHYLAERSRNNLFYLVRNCYFEPSTNGNIDWVNNCLKQIESAFQFSKPAIVAMHRLNFISGVDIKNRDKNLKYFDILLGKIIRKWPDVEFMSSDQLAAYIENDEEQNTHVRNSRLRRF